DHTVRVVPAAVPWADTTHTCPTRHAPRSRCHSCLWESASAVARPRAPVARDHNRTSPDTVAAESADDVPARRSPATLNLRWPTSSWPAFRSADIPAIPSAARQTPPPSADENSRVGRVLPDRAARRASLMQRTTPTDRASRSSGPCGSPSPTYGQTARRGEYESPLSLGGVLRPTAGCVLRHPHVGFSNSPLHSEVH